MIRAYNPDTDRDAVLRIWRECGWLGSSTDPEPWLAFMAAGAAMVAELGGEAECLVLTMPGTVRHLADDLALCAVTGVTTSRIARKQRLARRVLAEALAANVAQGAQVAGLGMFEQGYYNTLGFGTGGYEHWISFDPAHLKVDVEPRVPLRLGLADSERMHAARLARRRGHGATNLTPSAATHAAMCEEPGFGLGYADGPDGAVTHHVWIHAEDMAEHGPYRVKWLAWQEPAQFLELMALIKSLGDQVRRVDVHEPQGIQMQDLVDRPFRHYIATARSKYEARVQAEANWQVRILDLPGCLARTRLPWADLRFGLRLTDPIADHLPEDAPWRGVAGSYVVTLGPTCHIEPGADAALPTLEASVNAFTRLWLGVRPAAGLAVTDQLRGPESLLAALDFAFRLPDPRPDWDY
jgi:hypothetical protein